MSDIQTHHTPSEVPTTQSILEEYGSLRWQKTVIEAKLKEIESLAIQQALDILGEGKAVNGKRIVHSTDTVEIVLQLRNHVPKPNEYPDLEHLQEMIEIEEAKAARQNADQIAQVQQKIAVLEAHLVGLTNTNAGLEYRAEFATLQQQLTTKKPILSVKLK